MKLPIIKMLKRREYQNIASFQDVIVSVLYSAESRVVLHGGTAIWRCYNGSRFSSDIDIYIASNKNLENIKKNILAAAPDYNVNIEKIKDTGNLIFMAFSSGNAYLKVDINHKKERLDPITARFEKTDGTYTDVLTLPPTVLMLEKISAYVDRRFIRDIYDIYLLSDYTEETKAIKKEVLSFLDQIKPPVNEEDLKALIYQGPVPSFKNMVSHIKRRFS